MDLESSMHPVFPQLLQFSDGALLCLRLMVAVVFFESGRRHAGDPVGRAASIARAPDSPGSWGALRWRRRSVSHSVFSHRWRR